ncbi:polyribonucleotide 5'-hydroxyl-kinase [Nematocida homosporus]|uniref:polyribonucleotide 5'-hydroxyl-kinase n=1 Tax=Nematocida homosporus TaxID=1912981 RepID=UPI002220FF75|nr:polyribonucleotide 5'-hydroxyl-kinase [Nematocida homosporus]KAI5184314.1 polyribonucleotide 5'-hydroxyl-kinase [Nematocida homosporus]
MDIQMKAGCELRVEMPPDAKAKFVVVENTAEENGQELLLGKWYTVKDDLFFIFTYTGCKLKLAIEGGSYYISEDSNMPYIFNMFTAFWRLHKKRLLIVGNGRTTLSSILSNYFIRKGEKVLCLDLDVYSGSLLFPGTITSAVVQDVFSHVEPLSTTEKLSFFYGSASATDNTDLYTLLQGEMLAACRKKNFTGPTIITTPKGASKQEIEAILAQYPVDYLIVVGNEKLCHQITAENKVYIPAFPGLVRRETERRHIQISARIKKYFYGEQAEYNPCIITIPITTEDDPETKGNEHQYRIVQVGDEFMAPMSALPLGSSRRKNSTAVIDVEPIEGAVLAISSAKIIDEVPSSPAMGFLLVLKVQDNEVKVLCPQPKCPLKPFLVQGKIRFLE